MKHFIAILLAVLVFQIQSEKWNNLSKLQRVKVVNKMMDRYKSENETCQRVKVEIGEDGKLTGFIVSCDKYFERRSI